MIWLPRRELLLPQRRQPRGLRTMRSQGGFFSMPPGMGMHGRSARAIGPRYAVYAALPSSTFTTSSTTYVPVLDGSGGTPVAVTFIKTSPSTIPLLVSVGAAAIGLAGVTQATTLGIHDSSSNTVADVCEMKVGGHANSGKECWGEKIYTGLGPGTYTFTQNVKMADSSFSITSVASAFLSVLELGLDASLPINAVSAYQAFTSTFSTSTLNSYLNILTGSGGSPVTASLTKKAGTNVLARISSSVANTAGGDHIRLAVNDGTTSWDVGKCRVDTANTQRSAMCFERILTGIPAGPQAYTAQYFSIFGTTNFSNLTSVTLTLIELENLNVVNFYSNFTGNSSPASATYVPLRLATPSGAFVTLNITKGATSNLFVRAGATGASGSPASIQFGARVNGATTDLPARLPWNSSTNQMLLGENVITGVGAGTFAVDLMVKSAGATGTFLQQSSAVFMTVWEVLP